MFLDTGEHPPRTRTGMSLVPRRVAGSNPARGSKNQQAQILWHHYLLREPLLRRETRSLRPPPPGEVTCCLARIMGESHDSGRVPGLDRIIDDGISSGGSRTFGGKSRDPLSFSRSGLKMGDFGDGHSPVSTVQSSRPTRTVCSDWATGLLVSSTRTGYPPTHLLCARSSMARFAVSRGNLSSSQRGAKGRVENRV